MHTREWYVDQFTARGLVYLPGITKGLRAAVRPERVYFRRVDIPQTGRGDVAAATWIFRGDTSWRRRGCDVDIPR